MMNENFNRRKIEIVDMQNLLNLALLASVLISFVLNYNLRLQLTGQRGFLNAQEVKEITVITRAVLLVAAIASIFVNLETLKILEDEPNISVEAVESSRIEALASIGAAVVALMIFYAVVHNPTQAEIVDILNPES